MEEQDPQAVAKQYEVHCHLVAKAREIHAAKMRVAHAKIQAVQQARMAHELAFRVARAKVKHAMAVHKQIEQQVAALKASQG